MKDEIVIPKFELGVDKNPHSTSRKWTKRQKSILKEFLPAWRIVTGGRPKEERTHEHNVFLADLITIVFGCEEQK